MSRYADIISYFRDCYQADTRTLSLTNFFATKVENRYMVEGEDELLNGHLPFLPVPEKYAREVQKTLSLYKKEKSFYASAFFITGLADGINKQSSKICAPLFLFPAQIVQQEDLYYVQINLRKRILNLNFLSSLVKGGAHELFEEINKVIPRGELSFEHIGKIRRLLEEQLVDFDGEEILHYPKLQSQSTIKRMLQPKQLQKFNGFRLISSLGFGVIKNSTNTLGILSELNLIAKDESKSEILEHLFDPQFKLKSKSLPKGYVPSILNNAQNSIVKSVNENPLTLVIGPPGTGKSYTIASLAIEFISKGKSVLISSKTNQAVDVIGQKIENDLSIKGVTTRAGRRNYQKELKSNLGNILSGIRARVVKPTEDWDRLYTLSKNLEENSDHLKEIEKEFVKLSKRERDWAKYIAETEGSSSLFKKIKLAYIKWRNSKNEPHWVLTTTLFSGMEKHVELIQAYIALHFQVQVEKAVIRNRQMFRKFLSAISARYSSKQEEIFKEIDFEIMLQTFPIWLVNMSDIHDVLPIKQEMFDLAIIDEATQCDIASCIPIFYRAKRVVVVGDPKQLRHVSFLSETIQATLRRKHKLENNDLLLNYRDLSILDLVDNRIDDQNRVVFLSEHFRSNPDLIKFSNSQFYENSLRVMTHVPTRKHLKSLTIRAYAGKRNEKGVNIQEAESVIQEVKKIVELQRGFAEKVAHSIGVITPFRDQADYINEAIANTFSLELIDKHQILCTTPYGFQGEERDVIHLSLVADDNTHPTAIRHMNRPEVFNVSITRARSIQVVHHSLSQPRHAGELVGKYLDSIDNHDYGSLHSKEFEDLFLNEVEKFLEEKGYQYWPAYEIAGMMVDIVLKRENQYYGVNLIGFPGEFENALTINELQILNRAGLPTFPIPYTYWYFDQEGCKEELMKFISNATNQASV